jgi:HSP20 family protein
MTQLTKKRRNGNGHGNLFPALRNDFFPNRFFGSSLLDFDHDIFNGELSSPPANITETNKEFKLDLSVPGMKREDFKVDVDNGVLTISSEKEEEQKDENKNYSRREFSYSSFSRAFTLPDNADENNITAKYDNGVLQLTIPKTETTISKPKKEIKVI